MSQEENLAVVRRDLSAPDVHVDGSRRIFNPAVYDGHEGMRQLIREIYDAWEGFAEATTRLVPVGDMVVAIQKISGRGRASMAEVHASGASVWTVRHGLVVRVDVFNDVDEALAFAGAEE